MMTAVNEISNRIITMAQSGFPLVRRPYHTMGAGVGLSSNEALAMMKALKEDGLVREISAVINPHALDYKTTLVAIKLPEVHIEHASKVINCHNLISHAYLRNHSFNLWITLATKRANNVDDELKILRADLKAQEIISLPSITTYKLRAVFDLSPAGTPGNRHGGKQSAELTETEKSVLDVIQRDLPLIDMPYDKLAQELGLKVEHFLDTVKSLIDKSVIRRYGANINHYRFGFRFNVMTCFKIDETEADRLGNYFAALKEVSHCYLRESHKLFPFNFFAMVHCHNEENYLDFMQKVIRETGEDNYLSLFSVREIKKERNRYQA